MRIIAALAGIFVFAEALKDTENDCFKEGSGAVYVDKCRDVFYKYCDTYKIDPSGTCNFETFDNASLNWFAKNIKVRYWPYAEKLVDVNAGKQEEEVTEANPDDWQLLMKTTNLKKKKEDMQMRCV